MTPATQQELAAALLARVGEAARQWLEEAIDAIHMDPAAIRPVFPAAGRTVGRDPLDPCCAGAGLHDWTVDDAARVLLLTALDDRVAEEVEGLYLYGDTAERRAILRALPFVELGTTGPALARDALRSNDPRLVSAALSPEALDHLSDREFAHAVLKCVFLGIPLSGIPGLRERATGELARMLADYAHERVAAGRDVPQEIWAVIDLDPPEQRLAAITAEVDHPVAQRRRAARAALEQRRIQRDGTA